MIVYVLLEVNGSPEADLPGHEDLGSDRQGWWSGEGPVKVRENQRIKH